MGGKQKQAQRTKGNVRPSSSARAAEMLSSGGGAGFVGFSALSGDLGYVPAVTTTAEEADTSVDPDFRLVLRKLSKKDATTKLKALQELCSLCQEKDVDAVKSALPFWPRIYCKVAIDSDRRVREAAQQTLHQISLRVHRSLAPHLRALMGTWLVAQADLYAPAASTAKKAFQSAFPPAKQADAMAFCKDDVLQYLQQNILTHTAKTLSDPKTTDADDMEAKYLRVVACSLTALSSLLASVAKQHVEFVMEKYGHLLDQAKFWKLGKHENSQIRAAFYSLAASICCHIPDLANTYGEKLCGLVLYNLDDTNSVVCGPLWEALLRVITTVKDCWSKVNPRKGVWPKLWRLLQGGGEGVAVTVYPNLLPFISHIPQHVSADGLWFHEQFFSNMRSGLCKESVMKSSSEMNAVVQAYMECLRYCLSLSLPDNWAMWSGLYQDEMTLILGASFEEDRSSLASSLLYQQLVETVSLLHKHSTDGESNTSRQETASKALDVTISILQSLRECYVDSDESRSKSHCVKRFGSLLRSFKKPESAAGTKAHKGVKFADPEKLSSDVSPDKNKKEVTPDVPSLIKCCQPVQKFISKSSCSAYKQCQGLESKAHFSLFSVIIQEFASDQLLRDVLSAGQSQSSSLPVDFMKEIVLPMTHVFTTKGDRLVMDDLVALCLSLYKFTSVGDRCSILTLFIEEVDNRSLLHAFLSSVLKESLSAVEKKWFKGDIFGQSMLAVTSVLCKTTLKGICQGHSKVEDSEVNLEEEDVEASWNLVKMAMSSSDDHELLIGKQYMEEILHVVHTSLPSTSVLAVQDVQHINTCVAFICRLAAHLFTLQGCLTLPAAENLLISILQVDCSPGINLPEDIQRCVEQTWESGVAALTRQTAGYYSDEKSVIHQIITHVRQQVTNTTTVDRLQCLCGVAVRLVASIKAGLLSLNLNEGHEDMEVVQEVIKSLCQPASLTTVPVQWKTDSVLTGDILCSDLPEVSVFTEYNSLPQCLTDKLFTSGLLSVYPSHPSDKPDTIHIHSLHALALCQTLVGAKKQALLSCELVKAHSLLMTNFHKLTLDWSASRFRQLAERTLERSLDEGNLWALSLSHLAQAANARQVTIDWMKLTGFSTDRLYVSSEGSLHTVQVLIPQLTVSVRREIVEMSAAQILSLQSPSNLTHHTGGRGHLAVITGVLLEDSTGVAASVDCDVALGVLRQIQTWREEQEDIFLFDSHVKTYDWDIVDFNIQVTRFLTALVKKYPAKMSSEHWDFILCSLVSWIQSCSESCSDLLTDLKSQSFASSTFDLMTEVIQCIELILPERKEEFPPNLQSEWQEFFSEAAFSVVVPMFAKIAGGLGGELSLGEDHVVRHVCQAVSLCSTEHLLTHSLPVRLVAGEDTHLPDSFLTLINHLCPLLLSQHRSVQITAYRTLARVVSKLSSYEEEIIKEKDDDLRRLPGALLSVLETSGEGVEVILRDTRLGESMQIEAYIEEHVLTSGYLLCWLLLLALFKSASSELRAKYAQFLQTQHYVDALMVNLFRLMPPTPRVPLVEGLTSASPSQSLTSSRNLFSSPPLLPVLDSASSDELGHLACAVYYQALQDVPAIIRQYANNQDKNFSRIIDEFTSQYVSPILCNNEISAIQKATCDVDNMTIRGRPAAREVVATYTVEEVTMELVVMLPSNYPVGAISVETVKRIGVATTEWRNWMLQLTSFLQHQNGSIVDGLTLWKKNVDKRFEGVEECMICFSVIHNTTCQLPKLRCSTCKKKFHSACLYKWFNTSNQATCPLCRSLF